MFRLAVVMKASYMVALLADPLRGVNSATVSRLSAAEA
jgi:hypothetical protein